jgi:hypothetical protein
VNAVVERVRWNYTESCPVGKDYGLSHLSEAVGVGLGLLSFSQGSFKSVKKACNFTAFIAFYFNRNIIHEENCK